MDSGRASGAGGSGVSVGLGGSVGLGVTVGVGDELSHPEVSSNVDRVKGTKSNMALKDVLMKTSRGVKSGPTDPIHTCCRAEGRNARVQVRVRQQLTPF